MITTLMIQTKVKEEEKGVKKDAQYVIQLTWPNDINCDVDIWVRDPERRVTSYQAKDVGVMHIERDDQGWTNDNVVIRNGQQVQQLENSETWVLRGKMSGKFNVNLHLYSCTIGDVKLGLGQPVTVPVKVELVKLNPSLKKVIENTYTLNRVWEEITIFNFVLDNDNSIVDISTEQVDLVKEKENQ